MAYVIKFVDVDPFDGPEFDKVVLVEFPEAPDSSVIDSIEDIITNNIDYMNDFDSFEDFIINVLSGFLLPHRIITADKEIRV